MFAFRPNDGASFEVTTPKVFSLSDRFLCSRKSGSFRLDMLENRFLGTGNGGARGWHMRMHTSTPLLLGSWAPYPDFVIPLFLLEINRGSYFT